MHAKFSNRPTTSTASIANCTLVACNAEIGRRCPRDTWRAAALQMLAMPLGIAVLCALHRTPSRTLLASHFNVTGH
jgi:hypothetical protein